MNEKEAELIGMHAGDGTLYRTSSETLVWELRGSIHEQEYYEYARKLISNTLQVDVSPKYRGPNSYGIQTCNKVITKFFLDKGFHPGKKVYSVRIPDYIKKSSSEIKKAFIRGLFDTDGCVRFEKNRTPSHYYPRIEFSFASRNLAEDLFEALKFLDFQVRKRYSKRKNGLFEYRVELAGFKSLDKWVKEIKPANLKHILRIKKGILNGDKVTLKKESKNINYELVQIFKSVKF